MSFTQRHEIKSDILKEMRRFSVYLPPSYEIDKNGSYPVIYILDGDKSRLLGFSGVVESLSTNTMFPLNASQGIHVPAALRHQLSNLAQGVEYSLSLPLQQVIAIESK
jgi:predicted alpha/beta superfamily hydrolase